MQTVLITGATSGIGHAIAKHLALQSFRLILCGRRAERLHQIKTELDLKTPVYTLSFDIRDRAEVEEAVKSLPSGWQEIDILVNNAGNAHGLSAIHEGDVEDWEAMIDINVKGLLYISRAVLPGMVKRHSGHVINIGSVAGFDVYPNGNVYNASKFAVRALNKAMRMDLYAHGIKVGAVNPGLVETEFSVVRFKGDKAKAEKVYEGVEALTADDIAEAVLFMISRPAHVNIEDIHIFPSAQVSSTMVKRT